MEEIRTWYKGIHEVRKEGAALDPEVLQRVVRLIDEQIARAFWLPPHLMGAPATTYEPQPLTLEQVQRLRDTWMPVFRGTVQPVRDYCGQCYYSNKDGARFCGQGLTMKVGCTQRELYGQEESWE